MSKKNFMSYGDAETILTEYAQGVKDVKNPQFTEASTRNNIASGESYTTIFGKIKKFFSDLKTVAFTGSYNDLSDKPNLNLPLAPESGGTGQTTLENAGNAIINALSTGSSTPVDADYFISQCAGGGSSTKTYHRRPISTLYAYIKSKLTASDVGALPLAGGTMTGTTSYTANKIAENYRPGNSSCYTTTAYMTDGNEALVWATKNAVTSFMFVNGEDMITNVSSGRWRQLTPGLQIKNNKVAINKLIDTGVTPSHTLDVNGDICCNYFDAATLKTGNRSYGEHNCNNMVTNGFYYYTSNGPSTSLGASTNDGGVFVQAYSDVWVGQIAIDYRNGRCFFRGKNNGTWSAWQAFKSQADVDSAYSSGRTQGRNDVKNSPNSYGLYTKAQYDANYSSGRTQGRNDVKNSPGSYGLYTKAQYDANYSSGRTQGRNDVKNSPGSYGLYTKAQYDANYKAGWNAAKKWAVDNYMAKAPYSTGGAIYGATAVMSSAWPYSERHFAVGLSLISGDLYLSVNSSKTEWEYDIRLTKSV